MDTLIAPSKINQVLLRRVQGLDKVLLFRREISGGRIVLNERIDKHLIFGFALERKTSSRGIV